MSDYNTALDNLMENEELLQEHIEEFILQDPWDFLDYVSNFHKNMLFDYAYNVGTRTKFREYLEEELKNRGDLEYEKNI